VRGHACLKLNEVLKNAFHFLFSNKQKSKLLFKAPNIKNKTRAKQRAKEQKAKGKRVP
jgi:hypothetical protein